MPAKLKEKKSKDKPKSMEAQAKAPAQPTKVQKRAAQDLESDESEEEVDELDAEISQSGSEDEEDSEEGDETGDSGEEDDSDEEDVDEEGMEKLMKALGEDGLDDFAQEQLRALAGSEDEESEDEEGEEGAGSGEEQDDGEDEDEDEDAGTAKAGSSEDVVIPVDELSDEDMLDEDAQPRQKVEIDNKVRGSYTRGECKGDSNRKCQYPRQIAMERIRSTIALDPSLPWTDTLTVTYPESIDVDVEDDLNRELALYVVLPRVSDGSV